MPGIPLQQALALQVTGDTVRDGMRQLGEILAGWRPDPAKQSTGSMGAVAVNTIQEQHMEVDICVEGAPKALDQGHGAGLCGGFMP